MSHTPLEDLTDRIRPRSVSSLLLWAILAFFVIFIVWAMFTKLDRTVHAVGRVVPTAQLQVVSNL
ncbi:MAG: HlyD family type I secretion periplasmic adaptor subunit, partial [Sphingomonas sp.]